jgi:PAS domain S-box-containing protein
MDFFTEAERRRFVEGHLQELLDQGDFNNEPRQVLTKGGKVLDLVVSAIGHRDANGKVDRMLVASKDITDRLRVERELRTALPARRSQRCDELRAPHRHEPGATKDAEAG